MIDLNMRYFFVVCLIILIPVFTVSQDRLSRGSVPEELLRPGRSESARYPIDTVIGELGRGAASEAAYSYANSIGVALMSGQMGHPALASINSTTRQNYLFEIGIIVPENFRIGGGRILPDGSVSFLVRFIGRDQGITGEMYIRYISRQIGGNDAERTVGNWVFEELFLEEARYKDAENQDILNRNNFYPYERFY